MSTQSNSWRFHQSYQERQEAYMQNVHHPQPVTRSSSYSQKKAPETKFEFPSRGIHCPSTPPNTGRSEINYEECWSLLNGDCFQTFTPDSGSGDTKERTSLGMASEVDEEDFHEEQFEPLEESCHSTEIPEQGIPQYDTEITGMHYHSSYTKPAPG